MKNTLRTIAICGLLVSPQLFCMNSVASTATPKIEETQAVISTEKSRMSKMADAVKGAVWNKKTGIGSAVVATSAAAGIATYLLTKKNKYTAMAVAAIPAALGLAYLVHKSTPYVTSATRATGHGIATAGRAIRTWTGFNKLSSMFRRLFVKRAVVGGPTPVPTKPDPVVLPAPLPVASGANNLTVAEGVAFFTPKLMIEQVTQIS